MKALRQAGVWCSIHLLYWYKSTNTDALRQAGVLPGTLVQILLNWHKSLNTDATKALRQAGVVLHLPVGEAEAARGVCCRYYALYLLYLVQTNARRLLQVLRTLLALLSAKVHVC